MIQSHIGSKRNCGVVLKLKRFSHLLNQSFEFGSPIGLGYLLNRSFEFGSPIRLGYLSCYLFKFP